MVPLVRIDIYLGTSISTVLVPWPQYMVNSNPLRRLRMPAVVLDEERRQERPSLYQHGHGLYLGNGPLQAVFQNVRFPPHSRCLLKRRNNFSIRAPLCHLRIQNAISPWRRR